MTAEPLRRLLRRSPELEKVRDRLERVRLLQERYRSIAPRTLASSSRVCAVDGTTVVIRAENAPVAAAVRAMAPRLLAGLAADAGPDDNSLIYKGDRNLTGLRVEVQVDAPPVRPHVVARGELPRERIARMTEGLADSPLKEVLDRMSGAQRNRSTRSKR